MKLLNFLNNMYISPDKMISFFANVNSSRDADIQESTPADSRVIIDRDGSVRINKDNDEVAKKFHEISEKLASCR